MLFLKVVVVRGNDVIDAQKVEWEPTSISVHPDMKEVAVGGSVVSSFNTCPYRSCYCKRPLPNLAGATCSYYVLHGVFTRERTVIVLFLGGLRRLINIDNIVFAEFVCTTLRFQ